MIVSYHSSYGKVEKESNEKMNQRDAVALAREIAAKSDALKKMIRPEKEKGSIIDAPPMEELRKFILESISDLEVADSCLHTFQRVGIKNARYFPTNHVVDFSAAVVIENKIPADADK